MEQLQATNEGACGTSDLTVGLGAKACDGDTAAVGHDGKPWPQTMDAKVWADEFCKRNSASDHATMLGWFANAIMLGHDTARWEAEANSKAPNVELTGAAQPYRAASSDRRERG